jgi:hypothetical protein
MPDISVPAYVFISMGIIVLSLIYCDALLPKIAICIAVIVNLRIYWKIRIIDVMKLYEEINRLRNNPNEIASPNSDSATAKPE